MPTKTKVCQILMNYICILTICQMLLKGRGRGNVEQNKAKWTNGGSSENNVKDNGWKNGVASKQPKNEISQTSINNKLSVDEAQKKFEAVSSKHQQAIQNVLEESQFSDDEEEGDIGDNVLSTVFKSYSDTIDHGEDEEKAREDMMYSFRSGTSACLVCIENIKREEAKEFTSKCTNQMRILMQNLYRGTVQSAGQSSHRSKCPTRYTCFCEKVIEPKFDPWLVPHSCGQTCGKKLKPECGHTCLLLCHPGPCPPCPKTVRVTCYCQKQSPQIKRCSARTWSCGQPCGHQLTCGQHRCQDPCHSGDCQPCTKTSKQKCMCSKSVAVRECATPQWQCDEPCGKRLACGNHVCEKVCHGGNCGPCPRSGLRKCPCGKTEDSLPCTEDIPTCGDTCGKMLDCGIHTCPERCHTGSCGKVRTVGYIPVQRDLKLDLVARNHMNNAYIGYMTPLEMQYAIDNKDPPPPPPIIQSINIHHIRKNNHWLTSVYEPAASQIYIYDSLTMPSTMQELTQQLELLYGNGRNVQFVPVTQQGTDPACGAFAVAFAFSYALGVPPQTQQFMIPYMREHLRHCIQNS
ncbi:NFXL1 [Mytilus edulis]|uniref:NFXL1 n=1 Tax=Mytilus edulis TaxID=6550 RepID=A0A8S3UAB9_MYTED|nr:NFXL1 [Mytilus edulis]